MFAKSKTDAWSDSEQIALVEFILLHKPGRRWPAEQDPRFWDSVATCAQRGMPVQQSVQHTRYIMLRMQFYHVTSLTRPASSDLAHIAIYMRMWST